MYNWRKLSPKQRGELLAHRKSNKLPWHSPPHRNSDRTDRYMFTAACYEHLPHAGRSPDRMNDFESRLTETASANTETLVAWVVLPNHYHFLSVSKDAKAVVKHLGKLHGQTSFDWNGEDSTRGRKVWCTAVETEMKSDRHYWATINYIHHNPVKHGYVDKWQDWPYSSAHQYLDEVGSNEARNIWNEYPITEYGKGWDEY